MADAPRLNPYALPRLRLVELIASTGLVTLSNATVGNWIAAGCPRNPDGSFNIIRVCAWLAAERRKREVKDDPDLVGGVDSPALERYRAARADLAEMDAAARRGELVPLESVRREWLDLGHRMRVALEAVGAAFGSEVNAAIRSAVDDVYAQERRRIASAQKKPRRARKPHRRKKAAP